MFYIKNPKINIEDIMCTYYNSNGVMLSLKEKKNECIENFLLNPIGKMITIDITDYDQFKKLWTYVPSDINIKSSINAGRFIPQTSKVFLKIIGPNSRFFIKNEESCIALLNCSEGLVKIWSTHEDLDIAELVKKKKNFWKIILEKNQIGFITVGQNFVISSEKLIVLISWNLQLLIPEFLKSINHNNLLCALNSEEISFNKKLIINELKEKTTIEDRNFMQSIQDLYQKSQTGVIKNGDKEYSAFAFIGININIELNFSALFYCSCGNEICKWIFMKHLGNFIYEEKCTACFFKINHDEGDYIIRRYKEYDYKHKSVDALQLISTNKYFKESLVKVENAKSKRRFEYCAPKPLKKQCIDSSVIRTNFDIKANVDPVKSSFTISNESIIICPSIKSIQSPVDNFTSISLRENEKRINDKVANNSKLSYTSDDSDGSNEFIMDRISQEISSILLSKENSSPINEVLINTKGDEKSPNVFNISSNDPSSATNSYSTKEKQGLSDGKKTEESCEIHKKMKHYLGSKSEKELTISSNSENFKKDDSFDLQIRNKDKERQKYYQTNIEDNFKTPIEKEWEILVENLPYKITFSSISNMLTDCIPSLIDLQKDDFLKSSKAYIKFKNESEMLRVLNLLPEHIEGRKISVSSCN